MTVKAGDLWKPRDKKNKSLFIIVRVLNHQHGSDDVYIAPVEDPLGLQYEINLPTLKKLYKKIS